MKFLIATGFVAAVSSAVTSMSWVMAQSVSETTMLMAWGVGLLLVGRQVRPRAATESESTRLKSVVSSSRRLGTAAAELEAGI
jgi:hypothetical protein